MYKVWIASSTPSSRDSIWNGKPVPSPYLHKQLDITFGIVGLYFTTGLINDLG
jgi:hypothetical protein